jgi:hypothetical protein
MFKQSGSIFASQREKKENETIRQTLHVQLYSDNSLLPNDCIPLPNCNADNIAIYKAQLNAILLQSQKYRIHYEPQSSKWKLEYGYESRPMYDRLETQQQKIICLKKKHIIGDCVLAARAKFPHNITNSPTPSIDTDDTTMSINWEHNIFNFDKNHSLWTQVNVAFYYDINKKVFFINISKAKGLNYVKEDIVRYIQQHLPAVEA